MAKQKTFNINTFVEEASEAAQPRSTKKANQETEPKPAVEAYGYEQATKPIQQPEPIKVQQQTAATVQPIVTVTENKPQRGRRKSLRTIPRENGKVVFLEVEADAAVARISVLERVDKQDIIRTALDEFLANHFDGRDLDREGSRLILDYILRTTKTE